MDTAQDAVGGMTLVGHHAINRAKTAIANVDDARADRSADPLVQIEADEINPQIVRLEIGLTPGMSGIENDIGSLRSSHRGNLSNGKDQTGLVVDVSQKKQPHIRVGAESLL